MKIRPLWSLSLVAAVIVAGAIGVGCSKSSNRITNPGTGGNPSFDSGIQSLGFTKDVTFPVAGTVNYYCTPHGVSQGMVGSVTIVAGDPDSLLNVSVAPGGSFTFSPTNVSIRPGGKIHWVWASSGHSVTSGNPVAPPTGMAPMSGMNH
jgi:plastocyanin